MAGKARGKQVGRGFFTRVFYYPVQNLDFPLLVPFASDMKHDRTNFDKI